MRKEAIFWFTMLGLFFASQSLFAYTPEEQENFDNEPPVVKDLLEQASKLLNNQTETETEQGQLNAWKAANLYCEAARYGSSEGIYRLGMLYAFGRGVTAHREYAANLFGIASSHGHFEAQKMLETIEISTYITPPCVLDAVAPERTITHETAKIQNSPAIDAYIAKLPKNKRWVVDLVDTFADWYQVDSKLILSIITAESNFIVSAQSNKQAQGLMQLIPATAERFNVKNAFNASQNIKGGVKYLRWLLSYYRGDVTLTVAAYNAGERAVDRHKGVPPYQETRGYVKKVMGLYQLKQHDYDASITRASPLVKRGRKK